MNLTPKQESFTQRYVELGNASEAYRQSYDAENMSANSIKVEASRLLDHPNVALTIDGLRQKHQKRHEVTIDSLTDELEEVRQLAMANKQYAPAITAITGQAKLHGLIGGRPVVNNLIVNPVDNRLEVARRMAFLIELGNKAEQPDDE